MLGGFHLSGPGETAYAEPAETKAADRGYPIPVRGATSDCVAKLARACARTEGCDPGLISIKFDCDVGTAVVVPVPPEKIGGAPRSCGTGGARVRHAEGFERPFVVADDARALQDSDKGK